MPHLHPPHRASAGSGSPSPAPGPGKKPLSPGSTALPSWVSKRLLLKSVSLLLSGDADCFHTSVSVTSSSHGPRPLSTARLLPLHRRKAFRRTAELARGRGLCRSRRLQRHPVLGAPGPAQGLQPHSVSHPQTQGDTPSPFRSASPSQSPTEKGAHLASGILGGQLAEPRLHTQQRGRQSRRLSGNHWERRRRAAPAGEATVMPGRPALTRSPAQSAKHTHRRRDAGPCNAGRVCTLRGLLPAERTRG